MKRKRRPGEVICSCHAYPFPHRMMGGDCTGAAFVVTYFENGISSFKAECNGCHFKVNCSETFDIQCEVEQQKEPQHRCPALAEFIDFNGIKLYGRNKA